MIEHVHVSLVLDDLHLRAEVEDGGANGVVEHADVLCFTRPVSAGEVAAQLTVHPGCAVCAGPTADGGVVLAVRGGAESGISPLITASVVHALLAAGPGNRQPLSEVCSVRDMSGTCSSSGSSEPERRSPTRRAASGSLAANSSAARS
jgi:hypothetical protein